MDEELRKLVKAVAGGPRGGDATLRFADPEAGVIQVTDGEAIHNYTLLALPQLYGAGSGQDTLVPTDDRFTPLLMAIEEALLAIADADPRLADAGVALALDRLCLSPEAVVPYDAVVALVQLRLRLTLSLNDRTCATRCGR
jgi:hypothetical protein